MALTAQERIDQIDKEYRNAHPSQRSGLSQERNRLMANLKKQSASMEKKIRGSIKSERDSKIRGLLDTLPGYESALGFDEFENLRGQAFGEGPLADFEAQRGLLNEQQTNEQARLGQALTGELQDIDVGRAGAAQSAYDALSMGGGLSSGARERIAQGGAEQSLMQRQQARGQEASKLFDLGAQTREGLLNTTANEASTRRGMQGNIIDALKAENERKQAFEQKRADRRLSTEAGLLKAEQEREVAQMNQPKKGK